DGDDELDREGQEYGRGSEPRRGQVSDDDSAQDSEDGEYFRTYHQWYREEDSRRHRERMAALYSDSDLDSDDSELESLLRSIPPIESDRGSPTRETVPLPTLPSPPRVIPAPLPAMPSTDRPTLSQLLFPEITTRRETYVERNDIPNRSRSLG
ncbi:MAG: hypothetical protein Q9225_007620, partial [Loekoesia sp. 1 TL-2023]